MPYKNKEDRTEAVRRYRERKKGMITIVPDDTRFGEFLREYLHFNNIPLEDVIEFHQRLRRDKTGKWYDGETGKPLYPQGVEVYFRGNMMIIGDNRF